jgi:hypothetical protein
MRDAGFFVVVRRKNRARGDGNRRRSMMFVVTAQAAFCHENQISTNDASILADDGWITCTSVHVVSRKQME